MKRSEIKELMQHPAVELQVVLKESRAKLRALTFDLAAGKVKNTGERHDLRKKIARILTALRQEKK